MNKQVILHIGFPKTGTTSIQAFFGRHRRRLQARGLLYPELFVAEEGERPLESHRALLTALMTDPPARLAGTKSAATELTRACLAEFRNGPLPTLFLSHETLSQRQDVDFAQLDSWVGDADLTVLAFVRTADEWLESLYAQHLRGGVVAARPFAQTRLADLDATRFLPRLRAIRAALPRARLTVLSYDRFRTGGLLEAVLALTGLKAPALLARATTRSHLNISQPAADVMFGAYLSLAFDNRRLTNVAVTALRQARKAGATLSTDAARFRFVPPEVKIRARERYRDDLAELRREFGLLVTDPGPVTADQADYRHSLSRTEFEALLAIAGPFLPDLAERPMATAFDVAAARFAA